MSSLNILINQKTINWNTNKYWGFKNNIEFNCSLWWNDSYYEQILTFTNNIRQKDGGTHLSGFRSALTRVVNNYLDGSKSVKKTDRKSQQWWH